MHNCEYYQKNTALIICSGSLIFSWIHTKKELLASFCDSCTPLFPPPVHTYVPADTMSGHIQFCKAEVLAQIVKTDQFTISKTYVDL